MSCFLSIISLHRSFVMLLLLPQPTTIPLKHTNQRYMLMTPLEQWARERGFANERYDGNNVLTYPLLFTETWASLWASMTEAPRLVPLDWALANTELVEAGSTFVNLHYGIRPVVEKRPERVFHGGQKNIHEIPEVSKGGTFRIVV